MAWRLPTQLESFIPPPASQIPSTTDAISNPWRGQFLVSGTRASEMGSTIRVTAVETDGDTIHRQSHLWPDRFVFSVTVPYALPILAQLRAYLSHRSPSIPLTTFIPDRIRDSDQSAANQSHFRSLSRMLWDGQLVAIVRIALSSPSSSPGDAERHGILLFPTSNSSSVLFGALFLTPADVFPDFVYTQRATHTAAPSFASTYPNSPQRGHRSLTMSPSSAFVGAAPQVYGQHIMEPSYRSPSPRPLHGQSSHPYSPVSPPDAHSLYRYASPAPQDRPAHMAFEDNTHYTRYHSESPTDPYHYSTQRGASANHPGYGR